MHLHRQLASWFAVCGFDTRLAEQRGLVAFRRNASRASRWGWTKGPTFWCLQGDKAADAAGDVKDGAKDAKDSAADKAKGAIDDAK